MNQRNPSPWRRWWHRFVTAVCLLALSVASLSYIMDGGSWNSLAHIEATQLSAIATTELFGTATYDSRSDNAGQKSSSASGVWQQLTSFGQPASILQGQLMPIEYQSPRDSHQQSSLFQSVQQFGQKSQRIVMGWIPYTNATNTIRLISENQGLTVASPQWISVGGTNGTINSKVEPTVIKYAHQHHVQIWALVDNQFNASLTHQVLTDDKTRHALVQTLVQTASNNQLDGLNIDFENMRSSDEQVFTAFVQELHQALAPSHISLSVDITPDIQFLKDDAAYFHAALSTYADYVVLMAYDEHWSTDQTPGPVADVPWVTKSIQDLLDTGVPSDKLILGVPFYARFWHVHQDGSVDSIAVPISHVSSILASHEAHSSWNDNLGVAYAKYPKSDGYEEVWFSTEQTLNEKLQLVQDDNLAGVSIWSLGLSDPGNWSSLVHGIMQMLS